MVDRIDGRRARSERSRSAIIDAAFALIRDGKVPLDVDDVAARAGVSVSSVFRHFDGLADMQRHALDLFARRHAAALTPVATPDMTQAARIDAHVRSRLDLFGDTGPILALARQRALDAPHLADAVGRIRSSLADQTRAHFSVEAERLTPSDAANLMSVIDALTSPDADEVMRAANGRTPRQVASAWSTALTVLLAGWPGLAGYARDGRSDERSEERH